MRFGHRSLMAACVAMLSLAAFARAQTTIVEPLEKSLTDLLAVEVKATTDKLGVTISQMSGALTSAKSELQKTAYAKEVWSGYVDKKMPTEAQAAQFGTYAAFVDKAYKLIAAQAGKANAQVSYATDQLKIGIAGADKAFNNLQLVENGIKPCMEARAAAVKSTAYASDVSKLVDVLSSTRKKMEDLLVTVAGQEEEVSSSDEVFCSADLSDDSEDFAALLAEARSAAVAKLQAAQAASEAYMEAREAVDAMQNDAGMALMAIFMLGGPGDWSQADYSARLLYAAWIGVSSIESEAMASSMYYSYAIECADGLDDESALAIYLDIASETDDAFFDEASTYVGVAASALASLQSLAASLE